MNILLLASHSVAEYDDIRMLTDLGYDVFCPGGYQNPSQPGESLRPALPDAPYHPELVEACEGIRGAMGDPGPNIDWAKAHVAPEVLDWADVIICHHFPERWIAAQWDRISHKRVIWRTCGQSDPRLESVMRPFRDEGMQIVRYSPAEARAFGDGFAGEDALIRFGKYPDDYGPWDGSEAVVGNITQDMKNRGTACGYDRWEAITAGLPVSPGGPGSEAIGGVGSLPYKAMLEYLRLIRAYLYLGTMPASYTLGLIEAMMTGVPVVPVRWQTGEQWLDDLWEADDIVAADTTPRIDVTYKLRTFLQHKGTAGLLGSLQRERAIELFGIETVGAQWREFLG